MTDIKIVDRPDLVKDPRSGAILNTNRKEIEDYKAKSQALNLAKEANQTVEVLRETVNSMKNDLEEIKKLLRGLK